MNIMCCVWEDMISNLSKKLVYLSENNFDVRIFLLNYQMFSLC